MMQASKPWELVRADMMELNKKVRVFVIIYSFRLCVYAILLSRIIKRRYMDLIKECYALHKLRAIIVTMAANSTTCT